MAKLPKTGSRKDIVVMVEFDPTNDPGVFTNWCGAKNFSLSLQNEIQSEKVGDCDDWSAPVVTVKEYSGQNITASMDATWTAATHLLTSEWARLQRKLNVRIHFTAAEVGQIEYYDGLVMLGGLDLGEIGNLDGNSISESVTLEYDGPLTVTLKAA